MVVASPVALTRVRAGQEGLMAGRDWEGKIDCQILAACCMGDLGGGEMRLRILICIYVVAF